ncbi:MULTISPECIES: competence protein ComJ [Pseudomonas]|uniref:competence protein ComJ n=1 Tax=Pseudomonas TaxID=286 RepID=UPI001644559C|nr:MULTISPECIES: competence protein ComJ [Pseudomonas]QXI49529.1 competence protein ComJ [Pseudomonas anuradhapurensis]
MNILVSYNQICVFDSNLDEPFNDWSDNHVKQGFSWREGSVSFGAVENDDTDLEVVVSSLNPAIDSASFRALAVPFVVPESGMITVGSIGDEHDVEIPAGVYKLIYELGRKKGQPWCRLTFCVASDPVPEIILADEEISDCIEFDMKAHPA